MLTIYACDDTLEPHNILPNSDIKCYPSKFTRPIKIIKDARRLFNKSKYKNYEIFTDSEIFIMEIRLEARRLQNGGHIRILFYTKNQNQNPTVITCDNKGHLSDYPIGFITTHERQCWEMVGWDAPK